MNVTFLKEGGGRNCKLGQILICDPSSLNGVSLRATLTT